MANLREWIEEVAGDEKIEAVVIGGMGWPDYGTKSIPRYKDRPRGKVLSWKKAAPLLEYEFDSGFGAPGCEAIYAWTKTKVIFIGQYDGSTSPYWIPRNPTADVEPIMPGG